MDTGGEGGAGGQTFDDPEAFFNGVVKSRMVAECAGAGCHSSGQFGFLIEGLEHESITSYKTNFGLPFIVAPAEQSLVMTWPESGDHSGEGWDKNEVRIGLQPDALTWLQMEEALIEEDPFVEVGPFPVKPGLNFFPLDAVDGPATGFDGSAIIFYAEEHGSPIDLLELDQLQVYPTQARAIRVQNPTFIINANPNDDCNTVDPDDGAGDESLHGEPQTLSIFDGPDADDLPDIDLGTGELLLTAWEQNACLTIRFDEMTLLFADDLGNIFEMCTETSRFQAGTEALELEFVAAPFNAQNGPVGCATECHGGDDGAAQVAMDLSHLLGAKEERDYEFACAVMGAFMTPTNPDDSLIITTTAVGATLGHPAVYGGNVTAHTSFKDGITDWICHEGGDGSDGCSQGAGGAGTGGNGGAGGN